MAGPRRQRQRRRAGHPCCAPGSRCRTRWLPVPAPAAGRTGCARQSRWRSRPARFAWPRRQASRAAAHQPRAACRANAAPSSRWHHARVRPCSRRPQCPRLSRGRGQKTPAARRRCKAAAVPRAASGARRPGQRWREWLSSRADVNRYEKRQRGKPGCLSREAFASIYLAAVLPKRLRKRSTRPPMLSTDFCVPV